MIEWDSLTDAMVGSAIGSLFLSDLTAVAGDRYNYGYGSLKEAEHGIIRYITGYYSNVRPHWYNGGLTPNESERLFYIQSNDVANIS